MQNCPRLGEKTKRGASVNQPIKNFSLWVDFIERDFLDSKFIELINEGEINGATSNPAIFKNAFVSSNAYKDELALLKTQNLSAKQIYEKLAINDIKKAAKILRPLYDAMNDGFVSLEIDPMLANNIEASIAEGIRLFEEINEPNVMIKVPATSSGYIVAEDLLRRNINVNVTLVFSEEQAKNICESIKKADAKSAKCVISVFVSRFDRLLNDKLSNEQKNTVGIYNAAKIYNLIENLKPKNTKTLFASTGVKGNDIPAEYYITELLAPNSVNTAPIDTIEAYKHSLLPKIPKLPLSEAQIESFFEELSKKGIDIKETSNYLLNDGLKQFETAFDEIIEICR